MSGIHRADVSLHLQDQIPMVHGTGRVPAVDVRTEDSVIRRTELIISGVLRGGVLLSVAVILGGIGYFYVLRLAGLLDHPTFPDTLPAVASGVLHGDSLAIVVLGLLTLWQLP